MGEGLALWLLSWALPWLGAAILGLWGARAEGWRAFWLMSGIWAWVDAGIALLGLLGPEPQLAALRRILWINVGLDGVYVLIGLLLLRRPGPRYKGFGAAILIQGLFLLGLDLTHALLL
ncbi:DUF6992 family protein [Meiothermus granaticius]|uniref:YhhN-like protein n=1 Tax=Meiothermus granaticius NBRC 107808 TaxID=1227551 RepID=A0A399FB66_9DEIN|nr:hypothetical protein [Meiothermus granaticius]RIH92926.1 hypothetical protein Mgrana_01201 [Meiothermus granaticius NBRC 107808]GEM86782.1 hypothetical protein MGR01S_14070 [Meiothermus granaticius NBRC 107808]